MSNVRSQSHRMRYTFLLLLLASANSSFAQESVPPGAWSSWLRSKIHQYETVQASQAPLQIWQITHKGQPAYYMVSPCCDEYNPLFSAQGKQLCSPTGGIHGAGDSKCPRPADKGTKVLFVWAQSRSPSQPTDVPFLGQE